MLALSGRLEPRRDLCAEIFDNSLLICVARITAGYHDMNDIRNIEYKLLTPPHVVSKMATVTGHLRCFWRP